MGDWVPNKWLRPAAVAIALCCAGTPAFGQSGGGFELGLEAFQQDNFAAARDYWLPLADAGVAEAQLGMGVLSLEGLGTEPDPAAAAKWFRLAAQQGNAEAQYNLGFLLFSGRGVAEDLTAALQWFDRAADQGHAEANYYLGTMYGNGFGTERNEVLAYAHFERAFAAATDDLKPIVVRSRDALGARLDDAAIAEARRLAAAAAPPAPDRPRTYEAGLRAFEAGDFAAALEIWQPLATAGDGLAQQALGVMYHDGLGIPTNKADAANWFGLAAQQGLAESQYNLGLLLFSGEGVAQDHAAAARWFALAGDQGHPEANYYLGTVLAGGVEGIPRDDEAAYRRFLLANESDPEPTLAILIRQGLETVRRRLSSAQLARAADDEAEAPVPPAAAAEAQDEVSRLDAELADLRETEAAAQDQLATAQQRARDLAETVAAQQTELAATETELSEVDEETAAIENQLAERRREREENVTARDAATAQVAQSQSALQSERRGLAAATRERTEAEQAVADLTDQLAAAQAARQTAANRETTARQRAEELAAELTARLRAEQQAEEDLQGLDRALAAAEKSQEELAARRQQLADRQAQLESAAMAANTAEETAQATLRVAATIAQDTARQIAALESERATAQAALQAAADATAAAEAAAAAAAPPPPPPPTDTAPTPERPETEIAVATELQEQAVTAAEQDTPPLSAELVAALQEALARLGYEAGPADGIFGAQTVEAVRQFQADRGLPETGVVTQELVFLVSLVAEREANTPTQDLALAGSGTGFVVAGDGHILTNNHVVEACQEVRVEYDGTGYVVDHVSSDPQADLALLDGDFAAEDFVHFRGGLGIRPGDDVVALGYPLQGRLSDTVKVTKGTISALSGPGNDRTLIQTTAPVQAGSSGGPLFDMSGNLVGVVVGKISAVEVENVSFAINGSIARIFLDAEGVRYNTLRSDEALSAADVADQGRRATVLIECWNPTS